MSKKYAFLYMLLHMDGTDHAGPARLDMEGNFEFRESFFTVRSMPINLFKTRNKRNSIKTDVCLALIAGECQGGEGALLVLRPAQDRSLAKKV